MATKTMANLKAMRAAEAKVKAAATPAQLATMKRLDAEFKVRAAAAAAAKAKAKPAPAVKESKPAPKVKSRGKIEVYVDTVLAYSAWDGEDFFYDAKGDKSNLQDLLALAREDGFEPVVTKKVRTAAPHPKLADLYPTPKPAAKAKPAPIIGKVIPMAKAKPVVKAPAKPAAAKKVAARK